MPKIEQTSLNDGNMTRTSKDERALFPSAIEWTHKATANSPKAPVSSGTLFPRYLQKLLIFPRHINKFNKLLLLLLLLELQSQTLFLNSLKSRPFY